MNVSVKWLSALLGTDLDPERVAHDLAMLGAPADGIVSVGGNLSDVVVARVEEVTKHPNADKLTLCTVNDGTEVRDVVCGAPNVKADRIYPYAPVGAVLPGDFVIQKRKIRGVVSHGMLCSAQELELGDDHTGILELDTDAPLGSSFVEAIGLADTRIEIDVTANRPDLLGHKGVARDLGALYGASLRLPPIPGAPDSTHAPVRAGNKGSVGEVEVVIDDAIACPRYMAAVIEGVRIGPSPDWLQHRLRALGARPINNVVDATNYILFELNQPLHAFDLDRLGSRVVIRRALEGELLTTLDGAERELETHMLMICDADKPVALAGVMGGANSEVGNETTNILLECAYFDPKVTRATRESLRLSTDASYRFERGTDPQSMPDALTRVVSLIIAVAGGRETAPPVDCYPKPIAHRNVFLRPERVTRLLGVELSRRDIERYLTGLGFAVAPKDDRLAVQVPGWRPDVTREVDLIEEIARLHGYDRFPAEPVPFRASSVPNDPVEILKGGVRRAFTAEGLHEARSLSLGPRSSDEAQEVLRPLSQEEAFLRTDLMTGLIAAAERNWAVRERDIRLFEIGTVFKRGADVRPEESLHLAVLVSGARSPRHWSSKEVRDYDEWDLKHLAEVGAAFAHGSVAPEASAWRILDKEGRSVGDAARHAADAPAWAAPLFGFEMSLQVIAPSRPQFVPPPTTPPVERDLALILPLGVVAEQVEQVIRRLAGSLLESVVVFDEYRSDEIAGRSVAWRLVFRAADRTLRDKDADKVIDRIAQALDKELGVRIR